MPFKYNALLGLGLDNTGAGGGTPGGSTTQIQYNDAGAFDGSADLTWDDTGKVLGVGGDIDLDDGGAFSTTLQVISQAANVTITQPAATGISLVLAGINTDAAYAGVDGGFFGALPYSIGNGRLEFSNALGFNPADGTLSCRTFSTLTTTSPTIAGNTTYTGRFINNVANAASASAGLFSGTWFTTGTSTTTKPAFLVEQSGATSTGFSTAGTGLGVNSASTFTGRLIDLQKNATSRWHVSSEGLVVNTQPAPAAVDTTATLSVANIQAGIITTSTAAAVDMTLPTGTLMDGGVVGVQNDMAIMWSVINTGPNTATLLVGVDHTIVGAAAMATGTSGRFVSRRTGTTTWVSYRVS